MDSFKDQLLGTTFCSKHFKTINNQVDLKDMVRYFSKKFDFVFSHLIQQIVRLEVGFATLDNLLYSFFYKHCNFS